MPGWILVGLDGTLTEDDWDGDYDRIGRPRWSMIDRVKGWIAEGREVRVATERAANLSLVRRWLATVGLPGLKLVPLPPLPECEEIWDYRARNGEGGA